jgi:hypothetical protein
LNRKPGSIVFFFIILLLKSIFFVTEAVPINNEVALPQPPPYTEIANQNVDLAQPTNHNTAYLQQQAYNQHISQESSQNATQNL